MNQKQTNNARPRVAASTEPSVAPNGDAAPSGKTWPCFPQPKACDRLKPSFCPKPKKKGVQKIMPTDDSVFNIAAANGMSLPVAVENLGAPLQVEASGKLDVCLAAQSAPLLVDLVDDININVNSPVTVQVSEPLAININNELCVKNVGSEAFLVDALVAGEVRVGNIGTEALQVDIGWNKDSDDAVPVYGQFEVCNCGDRPLQVELAGVGTEGVLVNAVVMGEMAVTNVGTESLCVALTNKDDQAPLCIASAPTSLGGQTTTRGGKCLWNDREGVDPDSCFYKGGLYPLVCAGPNETVSVNQIKARVTARDSQFDTDNMLKSQSLGELLVFPYYATPDPKTDSVLKVSNSNDYLTWATAPAITFPGQTAVNCSTLSDNGLGVKTTQWTVALGDSYGGSVNLSNANDVLLAKFDLPNPTNGVIGTNVAFGSDIWRYEVDALAVRQPSSCATPPPPQPVPPNEFPTDIEVKKEASGLQREFVQFTSVDCRGSIVNGVPDYTVALFRENMDGTFTPIQTQNANQGMPGEPYYAFFESGTLTNGKKYAFCIDKSDNNLFESASFEYFVPA